MRIVILGNSGSGKSTLARRLGADLGIPVFHMDRLHWKPRWTESSDEELRAKVDEAIAGEDWIIDGNYSRVLPVRLERADVALVLELPVWLSLLRVAKRWLTYIAGRVQTWAKAAARSGPSTPSSSSGSSPGRSVSIARIRGWRSIHTSMSECLISTTSTPSCCNLCAALWQQRL